MAVNQWLLWYLGPGMEFIKTPLYLHIYLYTEYILLLLHEAGFILKSDLKEGFQIARETVLTEIHIINSIITSRSK